MESLRMTKILILIVLLFVGCKKNNPQSCSKDNCTEQTCLNETKNNEIEKIILLSSKEDEGIQSFCDFETDDDIVSLVRDGKNIDTLMLNNKEDSLFINLYNLLKTAKIDQNSVVEYEKCICDTIYLHYNITNDSEIGYIKTIGKTSTVALITDTIFKGTPSYETMSKGLYKDIAFGETLTKICYGCTFSKNENYFDGEYMIIYVRDNDCISNDTIILGSSNQIVLNSYRATSDSVLFKAVVDSIRERL